MKSTYSVVILVLVLLVIACQEKAMNPAIPEGPDFSVTPMENEEAELAAIYLSDELIAPQHYYEKVKRELALIRSTWQDSVQHVVTKFRPNYEMSTVLISTTGLVYDSMKTGTYHHWDSLNSFYHLDSIQFHYRYDDFASVILRFRGRLNSAILANKYKALPGILNTVLAPDGNRCSTVIPYRSGRQIKYFFNNISGDNSIGCDGVDIAYFTVAKGSAIYHGRYSYIYYNTPPPEPPWMDTMRLAWLEYF